MKFNGKELMAILKIAHAMAMADGHIEKNEFLVMTGELARFGVPEDDFKELLKGAGQMEPLEAAEIILNLDYERKKYVTSYLGVIMVADGDIDEKELALWKMVSTLCALPEMSISDAINNMANL